MFITRAGLLLFSGLEDMAGMHGLSSGTVDGCQGTPIAGPRLPQDSVLTSTHTGSLEKTHGPSFVRWSATTISWEATVKGSLPGGSPKRTRA